MSNWRNELIKFMGWGHDDALGYYWPAMDGEVNPSPKEIIAFISQVEQDAMKRMADELKRKEKDE